MVHKEVTREEFEDFKAKVKTHLETLYDMYNPDEWIKNNARNYTKQYQGKNPDLKGKEVLDIARIKQELEKKGINMKLTEIRYKCKKYDLYI